MPRCSPIAAATAVMTLSIGFALPSGVPCAAADVPATSATLADSAPSLPARELTRADVETWLDGLVSYAITSGNIAGGVVVVVKDGSVLLQKGYGYADVERRIPVDPARTLFRVGSVTKVFTWTAVMQLIEAGRIDLDRDINAYLDFEIPASFPQPITMRHLMTHTAGFEERVKSMMGAGPGQRLPLQEYVKTSLPPRAHAPGAVPSYSNYGAALAGYIVQRVSGEDFDDYIERHLLQPLGMQHSTSRQPLPQTLAATMSQGYVTATDAPWYFEICNPVPAGSLSATGADMAQFMISHLGAESGRDTRLLRPHAARMLHDSVSRPIAGLNGLSLGFEVNRDVRRIIGHGGDTKVFHSDLKLFLDDGVGLFMALNSTGEDGAAWDLLTALFEQFTARYSPVPLPEEPTAATALEHGQQLAAAGPYVSSRRADSSFFRLLALLGQQSIDVNDDATISLPSETGLDGQPKVWREIAPYVWREVGGTQRLGAQIVDGRVQAVGLDIYAGTQVLQPAAVAGMPHSALTLFMWASVALLLTVVHWPIAAIVRRHYAMPLMLPSREALMRRLVRVGALVALACVLGWMLLLKIGMDDLSSFNSSLDPWLTLLRLLGLLVVAATALAAWNVWEGWRGRQGRWAFLWNVAIAAAFVVFVWFAFTFNLITLSLQY